MIAVLIISLPSFLVIEIMKCDNVWLIGASATGTMISVMYLVFAGPHKVTEETE